MALTREQLFDTMGPLQDLIASPGWTVFARELQARRTRHLLNLTIESATGDLAAVRSLQAKITEIDILLKWPEQEIEKGRRVALARASVSAQGD